MSKTMKEQLGSIFVNTCGEICNNLATTKSEVGPVKRKSIDKDKTSREDMGKARKKLMELRGKEREMEQRIKALRSEGL